jgi:hypothetical protein
MLSKSLTLDDLNKLYSEGETTDQALYSEYRSNVLLVSGDHFLKSNSNYFNRIRDSKQLSSELKLKISINYIQRITKQIVNGIMTYAPNVKVYPKNGAELQDQKAAELNQAVYSDLDHRHRLKSRRWEHCEDFVNIGETWSEILFDPTAGTQLPPKPVLNELGQPVFDPLSGQPMMEDGGFTGDILFKRHFAFNILRASEAKSLDESKHFIIREMVAISDLKRMVETDPNLDEGQKAEIKSKIVESGKNTFLIFDGQTGNYRSSNNKEVLLKKIYCRPCADLPNGYWAIYTDSVKLWEGELPKSASGKVIFPLVYVGYDSVPTSARARSIIKQLRPMQVELNRCISQIATDQLLGSDKIIYQAGTKFTVGSNLPGFRGYQYTGLEPKIVQTNNDARYLAYVEAIAKSMYEAANLDIDREEKAAQQSDPWSMVYQSLRNKKRYSLYAEKFEGFLVRMAETALELAKIYLPEEALVSAVGRTERINIAEFKSTDDLSTQIKLIEQVEDVESVMGKALMSQAVLQYVGKQLDKEDIGRVLRSMPFLNDEESFGGLALNYDSIKNEILSLDRGKWRPAHPTDDHAKFIQAFIARKRKSDFEFLPPQVQQMYDQRIQQHEQMQAEQQQKIIAAKNEYIPAGGLLVGVDMYVPGSDPNGKLRRARLPYDAVLWLIKALENQGHSLQTLENMNQQALADMAGMMGATGGQQSQQQMSPDVQNITNEQLNSIARNTYGGVTPNG